MQTFLPLPSFTDSALVLDNKRLGKQRLEAKQLINALVHNTGWRHHPAARMWRGHVPALAVYMNCMISEWINRGFNNSMSLWAPSEFEGSRDYPSWFGNPDFHASHRSNLLRKDPIYYGQFGWLEPPNLPYIWPI